MAIDPYEPELAKRQKAFQIACQQLSSALNAVRPGVTKDFRQRLDRVFEAMEDYRRTAESLAQWMEQRPQ